MILKIVNKRLKTHEIYECTGTTIYKHKNRENIKNHTGWNILLSSKKSITHFILWGDEIRWINDLGETVSMLCQFVSKRYIQDLFF